MNSAENSAWLVGVAVFVIHVSADGGKPYTLLCKRLAGASDGVGKWSCPGGCLDADDANVLAGAARETREETGRTLDLASCEKLPLFKEGRRSASAWAEDGVSRAAFQPYVTVFVAGALTGDDGESLPIVENPEPDKHSDWQWVDTEWLEAHTSDDVWDRDDLLALLSAYGK